MITESGIILMILPFGEYPETIDTKLVVGKSVDSLRDYMICTKDVKESIINTIRTGCAVTVHCSEDGHRRLGATIFVNHFCAIFRLFAQRD